MDSRFRGNDGMAADTCVNENIGSVAPRPIHGITPVNGASANHRFPIQQRRNSCSLALNKTLFSVY
jgi:hypothetical protein